MGKVLELAVTGINGEYDRATAAGIGDAFQQRRGRCVRCDHNNGFAALRVLESGETDGEVCGRVRRW